MSSKSIRCFTYLSGATWLALGLALLVSTRANQGLTALHDPVFNTSATTVFWILGACALIMALLCLFTRWVTAQVAATATLALALVLYRVCLSSAGHHGPMTYVDSVASTFAIPFNVARPVVYAAVLVMLVGGYAACGRLFLRHHNEVSAAAPAGHPASQPCEPSGPADSRPPPSGNPKPKIIS